MNNKINNSSFDNTGIKIQQAAHIIAAIGYAASIILGIVLILGSIFSDNGPLALYGLIAAAACGVLSYLTFLFLYGFGKIVEDVNAIRVTYVAPNEPETFENDDISAPISENNSSVIKLCSICGANITKDINVCHVCGIKIDKE